MFLEYGREVGWWSGYDNSTT